MRKGYGLLELVFVMGVVGLIVGGGVYYMRLQSDIKSIEVGIDQKKAAQEAVKQINQQTQTESDILNQISGIAIATTTAPTPTQSGATDPLANLGSNKYASGDLPLGDKKYTTSGAKKGYIYLCNANMNGGGAQSNGPWIGASTWNENQKIAVSGSVSWPNATFTMVVSGGTRTIMTNALPRNAVTGIYPVQASDPAYAYDRNPNSIKVQSLSFSFPVSPVMLATPTCVGGEVGVMTNGVPLFNGFDAELRDAVAHEVQDKCDGHPQEAGEYHYHGGSACIPGNASTVIGFAFDGFPITGSKITDTRYLTTSDLDLCHGITSPLTLDGKTVTTYHYVITKDFPYSVSCFRGKSTVKGPTAAPTSGGGIMPSSGGSAPQPPAEAIAACNYEYSGSSCSFTSPQGNTISGSCKAPPGQSQLACVPQ